MSDKTQTENKTVIAGTESAAKPVAKKVKKEGRTFKQKARRFFILTGLLLVLIAAATLAILTFANYSSGERVGTVAKLSKKGYIFKTYEGELYQGVGTNMPTGEDPGITTKVFSFSVPRGNEEAVKEINAAMSGGYRVTLGYKEKFVKLPWRGETKYMISKVGKAK